MENKKNNSFIGYTSLLNKTYSFEPMGILDAIFINIFVFVFSFNKAKLKV